MTIERHNRRHKQGIKTDQREEFERDRDRILYCSAFRRLAGVTQVVSPSEKFLFHNRLTHSLKVAQVGRRIAEMLIQDNEELTNSIGLHPEVVEAAGLGHDLGHPPFGHNGETVLNALVNEKMGEQTSDGFEGNAQTFRIVTKLARRAHEWPGLNLTRATLNALLKYPWLKRTEGKESIKFGSYHTEKEDFDFARESSSNNRKSIEAAIMDLADDIAYSVHDVEDFYRAGLIPLHLIIGGDKKELEQFLEGTKNRWDKESLTIEAAQYCLSELKTLAGSNLFAPFKGSVQQKANLRNFTSMLVGRYVRATKIEEKDGKYTIKIDDQCDSEIRILKELLYYYVFNHPNLTVQKYGQKRIISCLFDAYLDTSTKTIDYYSIWPVYYQDLLKETLAKSGDELRTRIRFISDVISSMTENEAYEMYRRLHGVSTGRISDLLFH